MFRFVSYSTLQCGSGSTHIGIGLRLDQDAGGTINAICCVQELRDDGDRLPGRGEHSLQGEEEQHARQDTRQKEGLEREREILIIITTILQILLTNITTILVVNRILLL